MSFKARFRLEFDIQTDLENMEEVLHIITKNIRHELDQRVKEKTEITCNATIKKIDLQEGEHVLSDSAR